jgi:hypothetical protein
MINSFGTCKKVGMRSLHRSHLTGPRLYPGPPSKALIRAFYIRLHRSRASFLEMWRGEDSCRSSQNEDRACVYRPYLTATEAAPTYIGTVPVILYVETRSFFRGPCLGRETGWPACSSLPSPFPPIVTRVCGTVCRVETCALPRDSGHGRVCGADY